VKEVGKARGCGAKKLKSKSQADLVIGNPKEGDETVRPNYANSAYRDAFLRVENKGGKSMVDVCR